MRQREEASACMCAECAVDHEQLGDPRKQLEGAWPGKDCDGMGVWAYARGASAIAVGWLTGRLDVQISLRLPGGDGLTEKRFATLGEKLTRENFQSSTG